MIAIILAKTQGGLQAVATEARLNLIDGTEQEFSNLTTYSDPLMTAAGAVDTAEDGWIALAED